MPVHWQLFIDESGDFSRKDDTHVVAGVLIRAPYHQDQGAALREAIARAMPGVAYPPHSWLISRLWPAGRLVGYLKCKTERERSPVVDACEPAIEILRVSGLGAATRFLESSESRREPAPTDVRKVDDWLRFNAPTEHAALRALVARDLQNLRGVLAHLEKTVGAGRAFVVGAVRTPIAASADFDAEVESEDPYILLLKELYERLFLLLRSSSGERQQVWVVAATRWVERPGLPVPLPLHNRDLADAAQRASAIPFDRPDEWVDDSLRLRPYCVPPRYSTTVHPGVVLADFVANRLRQRVKDVAWAGGWRALAVNSAVSFSLPVEAAARGLSSSAPLPTISASGPARAAILDSLRDGPGNAGGLHGTVRRWEAEQSRLWIDALAGERKEASS